MISSADFSIEACKANAFLAFSDHFIDEEIGLCKELENRNVVVCPSPVYPKAIITNVETNVEYILLNHWKYGAWHELVVPKEEISTASKIVELSKYGIEITSTNAKNVVNALSEILVTGRNYIPHRLSQSTLGWAGTEFLPYSLKYVCDCAGKYKQFINAITTAGSFEEWTAYFAKLRQVTEFRLMLAASFAAPLVSVVGQNSFILHLWGGTSIGKTVALMCALSVWGNPNQGALMQTLNKTENAMLSTAGFLHNLPFGADELQTIKSRFQDYDKLIMTLCEGIDRVRMHYNELNETFSWQTSFLFTGEEPCLNQFSGGGAKNRVIEVHCKDKIIQDGNGTANFVRENYGHAGPKFIANLDFDKAKKYYKSVCADIIATCDTTEKQAGAAALILVADWLSTELFWPEDDRVLTIDDIEPFLAGAKEVDASERAYQFIRDTIAEYSRNFTADCVDRWGTIEEDGRVFFNNTVLQRVLSNAGFDFNAVKTAWAERGYLERGKDGKFRQAKKIAGSCCSCSVLKT